MCEKVKSNLIQINFYFYENLSKYTRLFFRIEGGCNTPQVLGLIQGAKKLT